MTKVTVELNNQSVNAPVEIKQGQYVEIDGNIYICAQVSITNADHSQLVNIATGTIWNIAHKGSVYTYQDGYPIRFIDSIKITEE